MAWKESGSSKIGVVARAEVVRRARESREKCMVGGGWN
jgi:hypothetical protein